MDESLNVEIARLQERVEDLEKYKEKQNGALLRLADKVDKFQGWLLGVTGGIIASLGLLIVNLIVSLARG